MEIFLLKPGGQVFNRQILIAREGRGRYTVRLKNSRRERPLIYLQEDRVNEFSGAGVSGRK